MARSNIPFEIGARVKRHGWDTVNRCAIMEDRGDVVAGYTYWTYGFSILTCNDEGDESEFLQGAGLRRC